MNFKNTFFFKFYAIGLNKLKNFYKAEILFFFFNKFLISIHFAIHFAAP